MVTRTATRAEPRNSVVFLGEDGKYYDYIAPRNDAEVQRFCALFFGIIIPDKAVCEGHTAPLTAFCDSYFARYPVNVWIASRGLAGKSTKLGALSLLELLDGADVVVLGGSSRQSKRVHEVEKQAWDRVIKTDQGEFRSPLVNFLASEPTGWYTRTKRGNSLTAITASQQSARGPHPQRLRVDEADELSISVFDAAMGQAMARNGIPAQVTISSTHQYAEGTVTEVLRRAEERNWKVSRWCHRETHVDNGGWLTSAMIADARTMVTDSMWDIEYELGEPSIEDRLFSEESIKKIFPPTSKNIRDVDGQLLIIESPVEGGLYANGADWGKDKHASVITTIRYDCVPARLVAYERVTKEDWPLVVARFERRAEMYPGTNVHDGIGQGSVIADYLTISSYPYKATGERHARLYGDYAMGVERGLLQAPRIKTLEDEHKYATRADVFLPSGHPPDTLCSTALAWQAVLGKAKDDVKRKPGRIGRVIRF